jgi:hypothetical protein
MFFAAYALVVLSLVNLSWRALREGRWPSGLNGFLSVCFLSLAMLGAAAVTGAGGPFLVLGFTMLSWMTLVSICMHAFSDPTASVPAKAFTVLYAAAALCSSVWLAVTFLADVISPAAAAWDTIEKAVPAGEALLVGAAICAFLAFHDTKRPGAWSGAGPAALAAAAVAAASLVPDGRWAVLGAHPHPLRVALMSCAVFLAGLTGGSLLRDEERRAAGFGLLYLLLAGFPLRLAHQQMLMVTGAALLLAPRLAGTSPAVVSPSIDASAPGPSLPPQDPILPTQASAP